MAWSLREKVRGVNEGERRLGEDSQVFEGRADEWGREGVRGAKFLRVGHVSEMHWQTIREWGADRPGY